MKTVGQILKIERSRRGFSVGDVERETRIRRKYLEAIEESNWVLFPSKTYVLGVLKSYGNFLDLDEEKLIAFFRREYERVDHQKFKQKIETRQLTPASKLYMKFGVIISIILFIIYFGLQIIHLITPPQVTIVAPIGEILPPRTEKFELVGETEADAIVEINGSRQVLDDSNQFVIKIPVIKKMAKVTIVITGANGKKTTLIKTYRVQ